MNTFGINFRVSVFGESHGPGVGVLIDGCPPGIGITPEELSSDLDRRKAGGAGTTPRVEHDQPEIFSGVYNGTTTGAPIMVMTRNTNTRSSDYEKLKNRPRPGHADLVSRIKYSGFADPRGGGHFSGRLTWGLVVAGTIARKVINPAVVRSEIIEAGGDRDIMRAVEKARGEGDSIGGIIECIIQKIEPGLGEPFFWSAESAISMLVFSIPAIKGIEFGTGFRSAAMRGSEHNDPIINSNGITLTNNSGGINGGITNGNEILFRVAVKPTSSISLKQNSINLETNMVEELHVEGRHDTCIALRMPVIVESAAAIVLADLSLLNNSLKGKPNKND